MDSFYPTTMMSPQPLSLDTMTASISTSILPPSAISQVPSATRKGFPSQVNQHREPLTPSISPSSCCSSSAYDPSAAGPGPSSISIANKRIYLIRHAEAEHNALHDMSIPDPPLTRKGRHQAITLIPPSLISKADLIVTSPMRRTLQTTLLGFSQSMSLHQTPVIVLPELQETGPQPCDTGTDVDILRDMNEFRALDFGNVTADWNTKRGRWASNWHRLVERSNWVRRWLRDRPERNIVVVSHGNFLAFLEGMARARYRWSNVECRVYRFRDDSRDEKARIIECTADDMLDEADLDRSSYGPE